MHRTHELDKVILGYYKSFHCSLEEKDWRAFIVIFYGLANFTTLLIISEIYHERQIFSGISAYQPMPMQAFSRYLCKEMDAYCHRDYAASIHFLDLMMDNIDAKDTPERFRILTLLQKARVLTRMNRAADAVKHRKSHESGRQI